MGTSGIRQRNLDFVDTTGLKVQGGVPTTLAQSVVGSQTTASDDTQFPQIRYFIRKWSNSSSKTLRDRARKMSLLDLGSGSFATTSNFYHDNARITSVDGKEVPKGTGRHYDGPLLARSASVTPSSSLWPKATYASRQEMIAQGATAISKTIPTNPVAGAAVFLGELREGVPQIPLRSFTKPSNRNAANVGSEYLNLEFGIKPLISDLQKFAQATRESDKILRELERNSGRFQRKRYRFPVETTATRTYDGTGFPQAGGTNLDTYYWLGGPWRLTCDEVITTRTWFSGCYSYYFDMGVDVRSRLKRTEQTANKLYGTRPTLAAIWELTPWSWAIDWQSNVGDVISNMSALSADNLVIRWAYLMREQRIERTWTLHDTRVGTLTQTFGSVAKQRIRASPYGFSLTPVALSDRQWAIVAALGISRKR